MTEFHNHSSSKISILDHQHQNISKANLTETNKERDQSRKVWDTYKDLLDDNGRKTRTSSVNKSGELDRSKAAPKSYLQDFNKSRQGIGLDLLGLPSKKDLFSNTSFQGLSSTKNLKSFAQEDFSKQANPSWKLHFKRKDSSPLVSSNPNKSFGSGNLSTNFKSLKKQIGFWGDE